MSTANPSSPATRSCAFTIVGAVLLLPCACSTQRETRAQATDAGSARAALVRQEPTRKAPTDQELTLGVARRLEAVGSLPLQQIEVTSERGIVTLQGNVNRGSERALAAETALRTQGARAVVNRLVVTASTAANLADEIRTTLQSESRRAFANVSVAENGTRVSLTGYVQRPEEKELAERAAWFVGGVTDVDNHIQVRPGFERSDQAIAEDVARSLRSDPYVGAQRIDFSVEHGRVQLSGRVESVFEKRRARARAQVPGVVEVSADALKVLPRAQAQPEYAVTPASDMETAAAVRDAFRADPRVPGTTIGLHVEYGVVSLLGSVSTLEQKLAAGEDARNARGTAAVLNRLEVRAGVAATPLGLEQQVLARLRAHPSVNADAIHVNVDDGKVRLEGNIASQFERDAAERATASVPGVLAVDNQLAVGETLKNFRNDAQIKAQLEHGLASDPRLDGTRIAVSVERGIVTLRGKAANPEVYGAALEDAFDVSPRGVVNELWLPEPERFVFSD